MKLLGLFFQVTILDGQFSVFVDNFAQLILLSTGIKNKTKETQKNFRVLSRTLLLLIFGLLMDDVVMSKPMSYTKDTKVLQNLPIIPYQVLTVLRFGFKSFGQHFSIL